MQIAAHGFKKGDFAGLRLKIHELSDTDDVYKAFPILKQYPEFTPEDLPNNINRQALIKYVILAFDKRSPIKMKYSDPIEQRVVAAKIAGFELNKDGTFHRNYEMVLKSEFFQVNMMILTYLFIQGENDFLTLIAYEQSLLLQTQSLLDTSSGIDAKNIIQNINTLRQAIDNLKRDLIEVENDTLLKADLFTYSNSKRLKIKPEDYSHMFNISVPEKAKLKNDPIK